LLIYLAHPIDQVGISAVLAHAVRHIVEDGRDQGHSFYRPSNAFSLSAPPWTEGDAVGVDSINRSALFESAGVIAVLPPGVPTLGTASEIEYALLLNRPVCIVTTNKLRSSSIQMANWARRGAQTVLISETGCLSGLSVADALGSLPDPTQLLVEDDPERPVGDPALQIQRTSTNAKVPSRAYRGDAGLDLAIVGEHEIHPGEYKLLPTGIKAAVPHGWWGFMTGRSSAWTTWRFDVRTAVIDSGYRGELMVGVHNRGSERKTVMPGTRLAQYVLLPAFMGDVEETDKLSEHERGNNGYGSSGQ
jgi:dUTP pyrophosphatase